MIRHQQNVVVCPFVVLVDGREKAPYRFDGLVTDASQGHRPLLVPTEWAHLETGDYTIRGLEEKVAIERKSLADLYSTLGQHRERFQREHERLAEIEYPIVVVESSWFSILNFPPKHSKLSPKTVLRTALAWQARYRVPWLAMEDRRLAEVASFRFLEKVWKEVRKQS